MTPIRFTSIAVLAAVLAIGLSPNAAMAAEPGAGAQGFGRIVVAGVKAMALERLRERGSPEAAVACVSAIGEGEMDGPVQAAMEAYLTPEEISRVDAYVGSKTGQREVEVTVAKAYASLRPSTVPPFTQAEMREVVAFQMSPAGRKFIDALKASVDEGGTPGTIGYRMNELAGACLDG